MTSLFVSFVYYTHISNLDMSKTNANICKTLNHILHSFMEFYVTDLKYQGEKFDHSTTLKFIINTFNLALS